MRFINADINVFSRFKDESDGLNFLRLKLGDTMFYSNHETKKSFIDVYGASLSKFDGFSNNVELQSTEFLLTSMEYNASNSDDLILVLVKQGNGHSGLKNYYPDCNLLFTGIYDSTNDKLVGNVKLYVPRVQLDKVVELVLGVNNNFINRLLVVPELAIYEKDDVYYSCKDGSVVENLYPMSYTRVTSFT